MGVVLDPWFFSIFFNTSFRNSISIGFVTLCALFVTIIALEIRTFDKNIPMCVVWMTCHASTEKPPGLSQQYRTTLKCESRQFGLVHGGNWGISLWATDATKKN